MSGNDEDNDDDGKNDDSSSDEDGSAAIQVGAEVRESDESLVEGFVTSRLLRRLILNADQASDAVATQLLACLQKVGNEGKESLAQWCDGHGAKVVAALLHHSATKGAVEKCVPKSKLKFLRDLNAKHTKFVKK